MAVRLATSPRRLVALPALVDAGGLVVPGGAAGELSAIYSPDAAANAIADGAPGLSGLANAARQAPVGGASRYPTARLMGKVGGRELAGRPSARAMADLLRASQRSVTVAGRPFAMGGRVDVDEIVPGQWTPAAAGRLRTALGPMGPVAATVVFYANPGLVAQVGRADPRRPLGGTNVALVRALGSGGETFLEVYAGNLRPLSRADVATKLTRWHARWPGRDDRLHVLIGPGGATGQREIWSRIRGTGAGRALLANGPGAFGLRSAQEGRAWLAELRAFQASPKRAPGGETPAVARGGSTFALPAGARVRAGGTVALRVARPATGVAALIRADGQRRVLGRRAAARPRVVRFTVPPRTQPGRYTLVAFINGDGLRDEVRSPVTILAPAGAAP